MENRQLYKKKRYSKGTTPPYKVQELYSGKVTLYHLFLKVVFYFQGLRHFFFHYKGLHPTMKILDAGCGGGIATFALKEAIQQRGLLQGTFHAFDFTPAMLAHFQKRIHKRNTQNVEFLCADVLQMEKDLPKSWKEYDLIISASMLEYLPENQLKTALKALKQRLKPDGKCLIYISRDNSLTYWVIRKWWKANTYTKGRFLNHAQKAGFKIIKFHGFCRPYNFLNCWGFIVELRS
jgi:cyclopropane fatty-acyl-phospholipid synthase-like methyltransferase